MAALQVALYALLGTALVFAIIELGLAAYVSTLYGTHSYTFYDGYGYVSQKYQTSTPAIVGFIIFTACWTILVSVGALVLPWFFARRGVVSSGFNTLLGTAFLATFFFTMVFWLASFADVAALLDGTIFSSADDNAVLAFAVLEWLIFLALVILTVLSLLGVLVVDWPGYQSLRKSRAANAPASALPMSTTPVAPSEPSTRDAEGLHNQPRSQEYSASVPSAIASAELSGDNSVHHELHAGHDERHGQP